MNRREAISSVAMLIGGVVIGGEVFALAGCNSTPQQINGLFNTADISLMDEIAETIIPKTGTPGAKEAKVGAFMAVMVKDCYTPEQQKVFIDGLKTINEESNKTYQNNFIALTDQQKKTLLNSLDKEQKEYTAKLKEQPKKDNEVQLPHYFRLMKQLTLLGFFTSEVGGTKVLTYMDVPGRYDACIPYKKGDPVYLNP
jgi:hypothetical protein